MTDHTGSTSLAMRLLAGASLALVPAVASAQSPAGDRVMVIGQRADGTSISRLSQSVVDTPQSITVVSSQELESRAISNINDALRNVPGITLGAGEFSWQGNTPTIRGFVARNDLFLDGMRDFGSYYRDPFNMQQIEVLQGPSSVYFGRGSTGGVVNQTTKSPSRAQAMTVTAAGGTDSTARATADINTPIGDTAAFRLNLMAHTNEIEGRDQGEYNRYGIAPSLALGIGTPTRLTVSAFHQEEDNLPDYGLPWYFGRPAPVDRSNYYGFSDDYLNTRADILTVRVEHDLADRVTIRNQLRYADYERDFRISEPVLAAGTTAGQPFGTVQISRNMWSGDSTESQLLNQLDLIADFDAGGVSHTLVAGVELGWERSRPDFNNTMGTPNDSLLDPGPAEPFPAGLNTYTRVAADTQAETLAFYAVDTIRLSQQWELSLGARWDRFDADYSSITRNPAGIVTSSAFIPQVDEKASWRGALVYKPTESTNIYAAFGTSFNPSAEGLSQITSGRALGTNNANLDPEENETYEIGAKMELASNLLLTGAVFRLEKTNARVPDPLNPGFNMLGGVQRVDGFQAQIGGYVTPAWYLSAGYTYLDSEVATSAAGAAPVGRPLINAPEHSASFLTEYHFENGFTIGASAVLMDERLAQNTGATPLVAPGFITVDAMAKYEFTDQVALQLNVFNLMDHEYFDQLHAWHIPPAAGRSALLTLTFRR